MPEYPWDVLGDKSKTAAPTTEPPPLPATPAPPVGGDRDWSQLGRRVDPLTGQPPQSISAGDQSPVQRSLNYPVSESNIPGPGVQAASSMATDPEQRRRIVAASLFPDMNPLQAQSRVFYGPAGRMGAVGPDGKAFWVDPGSYSPDVFHPSTWLPDNVGARLGGLAGPAIASTGAVIGGLATAPESLVAGPLAAGAGAAAGDLARQWMARQLDPGVPAKAPGAAPTPQPYNLGQTAAEGAGAAGGQLVAAGIARQFFPNPLGVNPLDRKALADPVVQQRIAEANARANALGIRLTPGQASGLPSFIGSEDAIASGSVPGKAGAEGADVARTFFEEQRRRLINAFDRTADTVSPASDKTDAALQFQQGTEDATRIVRQQGNTAARPYYQAAEAGGQVMSPDLAALHPLPGVQRALREAAIDYEDRTGHAANLNAPDFQLWNIAKTKLDDAISAAKDAREYSRADALDNIRTRFVSALDDAYPTYAQARATTAPTQQLAARMENAVGSAAGDGSETAGKITRGVFESNNPRAIKEMRDAYDQAGRTDEWNAGVRAYLQDVFDRTIRSQEGINPQMLRRQLWSDPNARDAMRNAMDPRAFAGFENFMRTVQDVAQSRGMNSLTAPRQAAAKDLVERASDTPMQYLVGALKGTSVLRLADIGGRGADAIQGWMTNRNLGNIAKNLFSPEGQQYLRSMATMPRGPQAIAATARFLGEQAGAYGSAPPKPRNEMAPQQ